jgi:hypothetical protein
MYTFTELAVYVCVSIATGAVSVGIALSVVTILHMIGEIIRGEA